jgi:hypothetical protein
MGESFSFHGMKIIRKSDNIKIVDIEATIDFGVKLIISSRFLEKEIVIIRRPLYPWAKGNQYNKRVWLKNKPKFSNIGARVSEKIKRNSENILK